MTIPVQHRTLLDEENEEYQIIGVGAVFIILRTCYVLVVRELTSLSLIPLLVPVEFVPL